MVTETLMTLDTDALTAMPATDALLALLVTEVLESRELIAEVLESRELIAEALAALKVQDEFNRRTSTSTPRS